MFATFAPVWRGTTRVAVSVFQTFSICCARSTLTLHCDVLTKRNVKTAFSKKLFWVLLALTAPVFRPTFALGGEGAAETMPATATDQTIVGAKLFRTILFYPASLTEQKTIERFTAEIVRKTGEMEIVKKPMPTFENFARRRAVADERDKLCKDYGAIVLVGVWQKRAHVKLVLCRAKKVYQRFFEGGDPDASLGMAGIWTGALLRPDRLKLEEEGGPPLATTEPAEEKLPEEALPELEIPASPVTEAKREEKPATPAPAARPRHLWLLLEAAASVNSAPLSRLVQGGPELKVAYLDEEGWMLGLRASFFPQLKVKDSPRVDMWRLPLVIYGCYDFFGEPHSLILGGGAVGSIAGVTAERSNEVDNETLFSPGFLLVAGYRWRFHRNFSISTDFTPGLLFFGHRIFLDPTDEKYTYHPFFLALSLGLSVHL